jgi:phosphatidylglycerophosphate synthase
MSFMSDLSARRPLKSRSTTWAAVVSRVLLKCGLKPNQVSVASIAFALAGMACIAFGQRWMPAPLAWLLGAACIQLRLLCNMMDGMLAVEGGLKSPTGDLYNEVPDRIADVSILAALGYAEGSTAGIVLGWLAACGAVMTACVRMQGASLTGKHDFRGPMAKPHRMALATGACLVMAGLSVMAIRVPVLFWVLVIMDAGIVITIYRRLSSLARALHEKATPSSST